MAEPLWLHLPPRLTTTTCKQPQRERNSFMPAKSKKQQMAAGAALAAKRGKRSKSSLKGPSRKMASSMSESKLRKMAKTKRKRLPARSKKKSKS
jgi:hypothetical protein